MSKVVYDMAYEHPSYWVPCTCEGYILVPQALRMCENQDVIINNFGEAPQVVRKTIKAMAQDNEYVGIKFNSVTITDLTEPPLKSDKEAAEEMALAMTTGMTVGVPITAMGAEEDTNTQVKYAFRNVRTGEWLQSFTLENDGKRNRCGIEPSQHIDDRLILTAKPYEPNQVRIEELLSSLSDDIWESVLVC